MIPVSNAKSLDGIRTRKQNRDPNCLDKKRPLISMDTETDNGDIFLLAASDGEYLEKGIMFENVAKFLLRYEGYWVFFYNLGYDAECILKLLPKEILQRYKTKKVLNFEYEGYNIHYIDRKKLSISKGHHTVSCYDIAQYYEGKNLSNAYQDSIKKPLDPQYLSMKEKRKFFSKHYYSRHKKEVRKYCIQDCILTQELAENWLEVFHETFGFYVGNWISSGYLAEKVLIRNGIHVPLFNEIPYEVQDLARHSFYGGRFELVQRGFIGYCCLYDINSAYPYALTTLLDITDGRWVRRKSIHPKAKIGFFEIVADIDLTVKIAPFPFIKKNRTICYPSGIFRTFVTLDELNAVKGDPKIKYKIIESYQFILNENCSYPFKKFIEEQYYKRLELKKSGNKLEKAIKIILNSIYGKTAQRTNKVMGNLFNPVVASYITGFTRAYLYRFVKENNLENDVVAFATDSIAVRKKIPNLGNEKLGDMKLDKEGHDVIFLSNGFYLFDGKWKKRGIGFDNEKKQEIEHEDSRIDEDGNFYIKVKTTKTTHIRSAILFNRLKDVGKIETYEKKINLNSDRKRFWIPTELKSLNDHSRCDSVSIPVNLVDKLISKEDIEFYYDEKYEPESEL